MSPSWLSILVDLVVRTLWNAESQDHISLARKVIEVSYADSNLGSAFNRLTTLSLSVTEVPGVEIGI